MLTALPLLLATALPGPLLADHGLCRAAQGAVVATELSLSLSADADGLQLSAGRQEKHLSLGLPRLRLSVLDGMAADLHVSISLFSGHSCGVPAAWSLSQVALLDAVPVPSASVAVRYFPDIHLSLLAPYLTLLARLGTDIGVHGRVTVGVGVGTSVAVNGRPGYAGTSGTAPGVTTVSTGRPSVATPSFSPPRVSFPSTPVVAARPRR